MSNGTGFDLGTPVAGVQAEQDNEGMIFNLNEVEEAPSFEVLPKGTYNAVVEELEYTTSQSSGSPMIKAVYTITDGEFAERKIYDFYVLTGEGAKYSLPKLKQLINRVCPEVDMSTFNPKTFAETATAVGKECQLKLGISTQKKGEYKGQKRNQVQEILASGGNAGGFM